MENETGVDFGAFEQLREQFGRCSSWALWDRDAPAVIGWAPAPEAAPKFRLNSIVPRFNDIASAADFDLFQAQPKQRLRNDIVLVALSAAQRSDAVEQATAGLTCHAFHEEGGHSNDKRLRVACTKSPLWGSYLTDLVKKEDGRVAPYVEAVSGNAKKRLRDADFVAEQLDALIAELKLLGAAQPTIVAIGGTVYNVLNRPDHKARIAQELGVEPSIIKITHYSHPQGNSTDYRGVVREELAKYGLIQRRELLEGDEEGYSEKSSEED